MATLVLSAAGAAAGASIGGSVLGISAAVLGRAAGATLGRMLDQKLLGSGSDAVETGRVERLRLTGASEGASLPQVYGRMRVAGQVVWASRFLEHKTTQKSGGGKGSGGSGSTSVTSYDYSISLAIALCEGPSRRVARIWADGVELPISKIKMRFYGGGDSQQPDPKIEAVEGAGNAPSYRGISYVVFEDLQLAQFGNRVPQFSFEILRPSPSGTTPDAQPLYAAVQGVALIPGSGEYTLATSRVDYDIGIGQSKPANLNTPAGKTDFPVALDALASELPNCGSTVLVVSWFGDDLRCGQCQLKPKIEQGDVDSKAMPWTVSDRSRVNGDIIVQKDGRPIYGGTPADRSVIEGIHALQERGQKVVFYPFILMEQLENNGLTDPWSGSANQPVLPWRGRITTSMAPGQPGSPDGSTTAANQVDAFFGTVQPQDFTISGDRLTYTGPDEWSYRRFVLHYAALCKAAGGVDSFCIGSEMRGLTQIRGSGHSFPAVSAFMQLAADVRSILGAQVKIGYASDWSEYFGYDSPDGNHYFHLDPLWAHNDIDFIGIDNYMPLSDWREGTDHTDVGWGSIYNLDYLKSNIEGGEGYDWYYASDNDRHAQNRSAISDGAYGEPWIYRYKDLKNWWSNPHHNRIGGVRQAGSTAWVPQSKPIWFTEYGCAAIDKGTNQPNKFLDPKSSESQMPHYSNGARDDLIQMQYIRAFNDYYADASNNPYSAAYNGRMVDMARAHVWAWDARPYPYFPAYGSLWSDGSNYHRGHWLNGRTSGRTLADVVAEICRGAGVTNYDVSQLYGYVRGYEVAHPSDARAALQPLMLAYGFDAVERNGKLVFRNRGGTSAAVIAPENLAEHPEQVGDLTILRAAEAELVGRVQVTHMAADGAYDLKTTETIYPGDDPRVVSQTDLSLALTSAEAQKISERWLNEARVAQDTASFALPPSKAGLGAGDVIEIAEENGSSALYRIDRVDQFGLGLCEAQRVEAGLYVAVEAEEEPDTLPTPAPKSLLFPQFMDLPLLTGAEDPYAPHLAATSRPWPGDVACFSSVSDGDYVLNTVVDAPATLGVTRSPLFAAQPGLIDRGAALVVQLSSGTLSSVTWEALLAGGNAMAIGDGSSANWEVFQFQTAVLVGPDTYELTGRLRGQLGTDAMMPDFWPENSIVVLLDSAVGQISTTPNLRGVTQHFRIGPAEDPITDESYSHISDAFDGIGLRPYAPVHLSYQITSGDLHEFRWIRRSRINGDDWNVSDISIGEGQERYQLRVILGQAIVHTEEVTAAGWNFDAASRTSLGISGPYAIEVAQISDEFGPGLFRRIDVNV